MYYTNGSAFTKTFHGVTFGPGETKEVFGVINDPQFVPTSIRQEPPKRGRSTSNKQEVEERSDSKSTKSDKKDTSKPVDELQKQDKDNKDNKKEDNQQKQEDSTTSTSIVEIKDT